MFKSILFPMSEQPASTASLTYAAHMAKRATATLTGLYVRPDPRSAVPYLGEGLTADMVQDLCATADSEGREKELMVCDQFSSAMRDVGLENANEGANTDVARFRCEKRIGDITDHVGRAARVADLAIVEAPHSDFPARELIFLDLLYRSGRPLLMLPATGLPGAETPPHILIAWNGRAEVARAVGAALSLLRNARHITLLQVGDIAEDRPDVEALADYLAEHGLSAGCLQQARSDRNTADQILATQASVGADMILIGAYSHARWREMILGGTTRHLVREAPVPLFMSH